MARNYIGVDLSRQWLDIFDPRAGAARIPNCTDALRDWIGGGHCLPWQVERPAPSLQVTAVRRWQAATS